MALLACQVSSSRAERAEHDNYPLAQESSGVGCLSRTVGEVPVLTLGTHAGKEKMMGRGSGTQGWGRAWLPGNLVTGRVISAAKNGLPQQAGGVILLLERKSNKKITSESR